MKVFGLFSGIGGFERSFGKKGAESAGLCEIDPVAQEVLRHQFPCAPLFDDVTELQELPECDIITAGFPCQDLSQAGPKVGIKGARSRLVDHVFRLAETLQGGPEWIVLENVSYMLKLKSGHAMQYLVSLAESLGYSWAYRVLDARCFGLPQRRERVVMILSKKKGNDPAEVLFPTGYIDPELDDSVGHVDSACLYGFYWTEGKRGLGWTKNAVPPIKAGSDLGIPSPPAIWDPQTGFFGTPNIEDAERLFGYPMGWTAVASRVCKKKGARWKLVGNTVCLPMAGWVCQQISKPKGLRAETQPLAKSARPPMAAFGGNGRRWAVDVSKWAKNSREPNLRGFLKREMAPLSLRASSGFYSRAKETTTIRFADGFLDSLDAYINAFKAVTI